MLKANQIKPLGKNLLVKPIEEEKTTTSGIYIPKEERPNISEVIEVGDPSPELSGIKVGDKVMHKRWEGVDIKTDQGTLMFLAYDQVMAIIE